MEQLELIPLTDEQKHAAGLLLASLTLRLQEMLEEHADEKAQMAEEQKELRGRIRRVAGAMRHGREPGVEDL